MHISRSHDIHDGNDDGDDEEDDYYESGPQPGSLQCPFGGCQRRAPFTTRGNLVRHFQSRMFLILPLRMLLSLPTDIECYEMCPFCHEIITQTHRFTRHDCRTSSNQPKIYMQHRIKQLNRMVNSELDRLQSSQSGTTKQKRGVADTDSAQVRKIARTTRGSVLQDNTSLEPHLLIDCSTATDDRLGYSDETTKTTTTDNTQLAFAETVAGTTNNANFTIPRESTTAISASDGCWAFAGPTSALPGDNSAWAFAETTAALPTDNVAWALAETAAAVSADDGAWAFAETAAAVSADDGVWAFAETSSVIPASDGRWPLAETGLASSAEAIAIALNDGGAAFAGIAATDGGDMVYASESNNHGDA